MKKNNLKISTKKINDTMTTTAKIFRPALVPKGAKKTTERKCVHFEQLTKIYLVETAADYTDEEARPVWSTKEDEKAMQVDVVKNIHHLRSGQSASDGPFDKDEELCARGLEHMKSASSMDQRSNEKRDMIDAILDTQDDMWSTCIDLSAHLAAVSLKHSKAARARACKLGASDATYVRRFVRPSCIDIANNLVSTLRHASNISRLSPSSIENLPTERHKNSLFSAHVRRPNENKPWTLG